MWRPDLVSVGNVTVHSLIFIYIYVFIWWVYTRVCTRAGGSTAHVCTCLWKREVNLEYCSSGAILFYETRSLTGLPLANLLGELARDLPFSASTVRDNKHTHDAQLFFLF